MELSDQESQTMTHMLRALTDEVNSTQEQLGNVNRESDILRKSQEDMLAKNSGTEMKRAFDASLDTPR